MVKLISKRYAIALFELAKEKINKIDSLSLEIDVLLNSIENDKDFIKVINHPGISSDEKFNIFSNICKENMSEEILGLISILIKKNREAEITEVFKTFLNLVKEYKGITTAYIYSATKLKEEQILKIKDNLSKKLNKTIIVEVYEKPDLIGGMLINVDGKVIDNSIKKSLNDIKKSLINN